MSHLRRAYARRSLIVAASQGGEELLDLAADLAMSRLRDGSAVFALTSARTPRLAFALNEEQIAACWPCSATATRSVSAGRGQHVQRRFAKPVGAPL